MKKIIHLLLLLVFLVSCNKDENQQNEKFVVGTVLPNSVYVKYEPVLVFKPIGTDPNFLHYEDSLDVDNDGTFDLRFFTCSYSYEIGLTNINNKSATINGRNAKFQIAQYNTSESYKYSILNNDTIKTYNTNRKDKYSSISQWETIYSDVFPITSEFKKDSFPTNSTTWANSYSYLAYKDSSIYNKGTKAIGHVDFEFENINNFGYSYLVFRAKNDMYNYGWIKLKVDNYNIISISETYFQSNGLEE